MGSENPQRSLDATGLTCPEPVLEASRALTRMEPGQVLEVLTTDPNAELDLQVFCARGGHRLSVEERRGGCLRFRIRKAPAPRSQSSSA